MYVNFLSIEAVRLFLRGCHIGPSVRKQPALVPSISGRKSSKPCQSFMLSYTAGFCYILNVVFIFCGAENIEESPECGEYSVKLISVIV